MFSFQQSVDHQIPYSISFQQQARNHQDLVVKLHDHVTMDDNTNNPLSKSRKLLGDQSPASSKPHSEGVEDEHAQRKLVHREIERQRRRDMATLHASLRGLLPLEYVKGKRSTSDHMDQAVNYIKHMQENIKVLSVRRDGFKRFVDAGVPAGSVLTNDNKKNLIMNNSHPNTVSIRSGNGTGVEILVDSCLIEDGFPLSRILKAISDEGHDVINCTCTKVNQRLIHNIHLEVNDPISTDLTMLQEKLFSVANNY